MFFLTKILVGRFDAVPEERVNSRCVTIVILQVIVEKDIILPLHVLLNQVCL